MKLNVSKILEKNKVNCQISGNEIIIWCPFCRRTDANGTQLLTLQINQETGEGECQACLKKCSFKELAEKIGIKLQQLTTTSEYHKIEAEPDQLLKYTAANDGNFTPLSLAELMAKEFKDTEWLVEHLVPAESIVAVSGAPAAYKTWLVLDLAIKVAAGDILFDKFVTNQAGVLVIDEENGERLLQKRLQKLSASCELPMYFISLKGFKLLSESIERILTFANEHGVKLVIFDSLVRIHSSDENDAMRMASVFALLKKFNIAGRTVVFTHHNRKQGPLRSNPAQDMRGSSDILASVDCHLAVERKQKEELLTITQTKLRQGEEIKPFKLNVINDKNEIRFEFAGDVDEVKTKRADMREAIKDILAQEDRPMFGKELFEALKNTRVEGGYSTFKSALEEMLEKGELVTNKGERNKTFYSLTPASPAEVSEDVLV